MSADCLNQLLDTIEIAVTINPCPAAKPAW